MGKLIRLAAITIVLLAANATAVVYTGKIDITRSAQNFRFTETLAQTATGAGVFTIEANGDYSLGGGNLECVSSWTIDGIASDTIWNADNADRIIVYESDDVWWTRSITINLATMISITSDNYFYVNVHNTNYVAAGSKANPDWLSYTLEYPVPEPCSLALLLAGGLLLRRTKNTSNASR